MSTTLKTNAWREGARWWLQSTTRKSCVQELDGRSVGRLMRKETSLIVSKPASRLERIPLSMTASTASYQITSSSSYCQIGHVDRYIQSQFSRRVANEKWMPKREDYLSLSSSFRRRRGKSERDRNALCQKTRTQVARVGWRHVSRCPSENLLPNQKLIRYPSDTYRKRRIIYYL